MRFVKFKVSNYKSFLESPELRFASGLNVIVGQNNSGKTALLEAMSLNFPGNPHRSLETLPSRTTPLPPNSIVRLVFEVDNAELKQLMQDRFRTTYIPADGSQTPAVEGDRIAAILRTNVSVRGTLAGGPNASLSEIALDAYPIESAQWSIECHLSGEHIQVNRQNFSGGINAPQLLPHQLHQIFRERVYLFKAERFTLAQSQMGPTAGLLQNAANLAQVLNLLSTENPNRFERWQSYVIDVFPQIRRITVPPISQHEARILVWTQDKDKERSDLAIPLAESGTGIGQVLAMLYVVLTADQPRVLLIDEPQSFLHPSAIRKLLEIFAAHSQHQYIITTHSPTALAAFPPSTLTLLTMDGPKTVARQIDPTQATELRSVLSEVGARLSDVFGADNILWVEGATEEACFPLIRARDRRESDRATGTVILGVRHTSDFQQRDVKAAVEIYQRLTSGPALMPTVAGFLFDAEGLSETEQRDVKRQSHDAVRFLPRRMFENYLLVPRAIAAVMNDIAGFRDTPVTPAEVSDWLSRQEWDKPYFERRVEQALRTPETWQRTVHGARLLRAMLRELSGGRADYDKVKHGLALTTWICANAFDSLAEIANIIREATAAGGATRQDK